MIFKEDAFEQVYSIQSPDERHDSLTNTYNKSFTELLITAFE